MIEYALNDLPRHGECRSVMSYADLWTMPRVGEVAQVGVVRRAGKSA